MKKLFSTLILSVFLANVSIPKAEAGVGLLGVGTTIALVGSATTNDPSQNYYGLWFLAGMIYGGGAAIVGSAIGGITAIFAPSLGVKIIYGSLILDADGSLPRTDLIKNFSQTYPFIDNQGVIEDLADAVNEKYLATKTADENVVVHFTADEVSNLFAGADLSQEQLAKITADLK